MTWVRAAGPGHLFCCSNEQLDVDGLLAHLQRLDPRNSECVTHIHEVPARVRRTAPTSCLLQVRRKSPA